MEYVKDVTINPCKMCMPMGASIAYKGIEGCVPMLHGSQGCSTYIRRHMATHYNEPVDIASSCLNEKGTIYGGTENLKKGLKNIMKLYTPQIIGVATTCLAETIGEDISQIVEEFKKEEGDPPYIVTVSTPGYGGSHYEGYYAAIRGCVEQITIPSTNHKKINIVASQMSPADIRTLKRILELFQISYTLIPDYSKTLDSPYSTEYYRIPFGGTKIQEIQRMSGAQATIEIGQFIPEACSPGRFLEEKYHVPCYSVPYPLGLENTDYFINLLSQISDQPTPTEILDQRGRLLDAMIDSHKYNGNKKAVLFGEPELLYGMIHLCMENGMKPYMAAFGGKLYGMEEKIKEEFGTSSREILIQENSDFEKIYHQIQENEIDVLVGHSDGRFLEEKLGIPLLRTGFPIHDRIGGQRQRTLGYEGTMELLDRMTNQFLENLHDHYRTHIYHKYYSKEIEGGSNNEYLYK